ncbi:alpha/beta fold hydrolase [Streptosporangium lutulentum]|uniref:Pimeloyl-ACP methyl ester carboxylesterase n=1 Tax=Streptosporangium lutulentum TaxID=1461250 RepID=A0ABT9QHW0_9ACTN|nr:alpha/beta hydrolase [Streptosporangium lutulentum]MDP9846277.1 pimeloyl-ACP methyl ester carboxylesterase [Streptosporangium lutulentum]
MPRLKTAFAAALVVLTGALAAQPANATAAHNAKPTVVLVHGAWADASGWNGVITRLRKDGYPVLAPANPLRGLASDAAYLKGLLATVDGPVILVGHSYGGSVVTNAAGADPDVKALVYVSAVIPDQGESVFDLSTKYAGSKIGDNTIKTVPLASGDADVYVKTEGFADIFSADLPRSTSALLAATQRPITYGALTEPSGAPAWKTIPSWALIPRDDQVIPLQAQRFMTARAKSHTVEVSGAHAVLISKPGTVTQLIETAARAVD